MIVSLDINYAGILVCGILYMILGAVWYGPLFGKKWMTFMKLDPDPKKLKQMKKQATKGYIAGFVGTLLTAFVLDQIIRYTGSGSALLGVAAGFWMWLGFVMPQHLGQIFWEDKPWGLFWINTGYVFVGFLIMGAVLGWWPWANIV